MRELYRQLDITVDSSYADGPFMLRLSVIETTAAPANTDPNRGGQNSFTTDIVVGQQVSVATHPDDPTLENVSPTVAEGGNLTFTISLDGTAVVPVGDTATVVYALTGAIVPGMADSAASPSDLPTPESVVITAGNRTADVTVLVPTDRVIENTEGVMISIVSVTFANDSDATNRINGNLPGPSPFVITDETSMTVGVQVTDATEGFSGDPGVIVVTAAPIATDADIQLERNVRVTLNVAAGLDTTANADYQQPNFNILTLTFEQGVFPVTTTAGITVIPDNIRESGETVVIQVGESQADDGVVANLMQAIANIEDNDVRVSLSVSPGTVVEDGGVPRATISLVGSENTQADRPDSLSIPYSVTGIQDVDLVSGNLGGTVDITTGTSANQTLSIASDNLVEGTETATITVRSGDLPAGLSLDGPVGLAALTATFDITDSDALQVQFGNTPSGYRFNEGGSGHQAQIEVLPIDRASLRLVNDTLTLVQDASVSIATIDGTATAGDDYDALNRSVTILAGNYPDTPSRRFPVTLTIIDDADVEVTDETFDLLLTSDDIRLALLLPPLMQTVTIVSNDSELTRGVGTAERTVPLTQLQAGYEIDPNVMVHIANAFGSQASTLGVTVTGIGAGDLVGLSVATSGIAPGDIDERDRPGLSEFFHVAGAAILASESEVQGFLQGMTLTLPTADPPDSVMVTMTVRPSATTGPDDISVTYTLNIGTVEPEAYPTSFTVTVENENAVVSEGGSLELLITLDRAVPLNDRAVFEFVFTDAAVGRLDNAPRQVVVVGGESAASTMVFIPINNDIESGPQEGGLLFNSFDFDLGNSNLNDYYNTFSTNEEFATVEPRFTITDRTQMRINITAGREASSVGANLDARRIEEGYDVSSGDHTRGIRVIVDTPDDINVQRDVTVNLVVGGPGDTADENDYSRPENGTLTLIIPTGSARFASTDIDTTPDVMREPGGQTVTIALARIQDDPAVIFGPSTDTLVTIYDNSALVSVARVSPETVSENNFNDRTLAIMISPSDRPDLMIGYTVGGINPNDLTGTNSPLSGIVPFLALDTSIEQNFRIFVDNLVEGPETMTITVQPSDLPPGFSLAGDADLMSVSTSITILDATAPLQVSFAQSNYNVEEDVGDVTVVLNVISGGGVDSTLVSAVQATVTPATAGDFSISDPTIDITSGAYTTTARQFSFTLSIVDDTIMEDEETFTLNLTPSDDRIVVAGGPTQAMVTIAASDEGVEPPAEYPTSFTVTVENENAEVREGEFLELLFTLDRAVPSGDRAIFDFFFSGGGVADDVRLGGGTRSVVVEGTESTASTRLFIPNNNTIENDPVIGTGRLAIGSITFEVEADNTLIDTYYVDTSDSDDPEVVATVEPSFTILDGTKATINITAGRAATADVPRLDVDGRRIVEGYVTTSQEHSRGIRVIANVLPGVFLGRAVTVNLVVGGGQGDTVEENDYSHPENGTLTLTISNGAQAGFVDIATTPDVMREPVPETLTLAFAQLQDDPAVVLGSTTLAVVTIHDNEALVSVVRISPGTVSEDSFNSRTLQIMISDSDRPPGRMVGYTVTGIDSNDLMGTNNSPLSGGVSFDATASTVNRNFLIFADNLVEGTETMTITVQRDEDLDPGLSLAGDAGLMSVSTSITVLDATPPLEVSFDETTYRFEEDAGTVEVVLNVISGGGANATLVSTVEAIVSPAMSDDFSISNPRVGITPGEYTATARQFSFTLSIVDDVIMEGEETFTLNLTPSDDRIVVAGGASQAMVTIAASDGQETEYPTGVSVTLVSPEMVEEETDLMFRVELNRPVPVGDTATVMYSLNGRAGVLGAPVGFTAPDVIIPADGTVTIEGPAQVATVTVSVLRDNRIERNEGGVVVIDTVTFGTPQPAFTSVEAPFVITDATPPLDVLFNVSGFYQTRENAGDFAPELLVRGSNDVILVSTISASVVTRDTAFGAGRATAGQDYVQRTAGNGQIDIPPGTYGTTGTTIPVPLSINSDSTVELDESFVLALTISDDRVTEASRDVTEEVVIVNDDATVGLSPQAVMVQPGGSMDVTVRLNGLAALMTEYDYSVTLNLMPESGLTLNGLAAAHGVELSNTTMTEVVMVAAPMDTAEGNYDVTVTVVGPQGVMVATPLPVLRVTVMAVPITVTQGAGAGTEGQNRLGASEEDLQSPAGVLIDSGITVGGPGGMAISSIRVTLGSGGFDSRGRALSGDFGGVEFIPATPAGFTVTSSGPDPLGTTGMTYTQEYTNPAGITTSQAQNLLRTLALRITSEAPLGGESTVTVTVQPTAGNSDEITVEYHLTIDDQNEKPIVAEVINTVFTFPEDSGEVSTDIAVVDAVEAGQSFIALFVVASTTTVNGREGAALTDLFLNSINPLTLFNLSATGNERISTLRFFEVVPVANAHGTAMFSLQARDSGRAPDDRTVPIGFTVTVTPVNDTPVITVVSPASNESLALTAGSDPATVTVTLSDADVSAEAGNESLFAQAGDTLVMSVNTADVTLNLPTNPAFATATGNDSQQITLRFTGTADSTQVATLVESVEVSANVGAAQGDYVLTIELATGSNDLALSIARDRLTGSATVPVSVTTEGAPPFFRDATVVALQENDQNVGGVTLELSRELAADESVTVTYTLDFSGSAAMTDVTDPGEGTARASEGQNTVVISLRANPDETTEEEESFNVNLATAVFGAEGETDQAIPFNTISPVEVTIAADDVVYPSTVSLTRLSSETLAEGETLRFEVELNRPVPTGVGEFLDVTYGIVSALGAPDPLEVGVDVQSDGTEQLQEGETTRVFSVTIPNDNVVENDEGGEVRLLSVSFMRGGRDDPPTDELSNFLTNVSPQQFSFTISDATLPLRVSFDETSYSFAEDAGNVEAVLNVLSGTGSNVTLSTPVSVSVATTDRTAIAPADYTALAALISIPAGAYSADEASTFRISLAIEDDAVEEMDETFALLLSPSDARIEVDGSDEATVTIEDNDAVTRTVLFSPLMVTVERGGVGVNTNVSLDPMLNPSQSATLRLTSAVAGLTVDGATTLDVMLDGTTRSQDVTIAAAASVALRDDYEVAVEVLDPVGVVLAVTLVPLMVTVDPGSIDIAQSQSVIPISEPELQGGITIDSGVVVTSTEEFSTVRVVLTAGDTNGNLNDATINGEALGVDGVTFIVGGARNSAALQTLLSELELILGTEDPPGVAIVTVTVRPDAYPAARDTVLTYTLNITDTPEPQVGTYPTVAQVTQGSADVTEGSNLVVTVRLDAEVPINDTATITYRLTGATADITDISGGAVTIVEENRRMVDINVRVSTDDIVENTEDVQLFIDSVAFETSATAGFDLDPPAETSFRLLDATQMVVDLAVASASVTEGFDVEGFRNTIDVTASASGVTLDRDVDVRLVFGGTAESSDYAQPLGSSLVLTFAAGSVSLAETVSIAVTPDTIQETTAADEMVTITVGTAQDDDPAVTAGTAAPAVTIVDNDLRVSVSGGGTVNEGAGDAVFTVTLSGNTDANLRPALTIPYLVSGIDSGDVAGGNLLDGDVTIPASETTAALTYPIQSDNDVEGTETAQIQLLRGNLPVGLLLDAAANIDTVTASIEIGDETRLQVSFNNLPYSFAENATNPEASLLVQGIGGDVDLLSDILVPVETRDGMATQPDDYIQRTGDSARIRIPAGNYTTVGAPPIPVPLVLTDDLLVEPDKRFELLLIIGDLPLTLSGSNPVPVVITDDDESGAAVTFNPAAVTLASGNSMNVTVGTNPSLIDGQSVMLGLTADQGLTVDNSVTLNVETTSQDVVVAATSNALPGNYQVTVAASNPVGLSVTTTTPLMVTVSGIVITQTNPGVITDVDETDLQAGIDIDTGIVVALFDETISAISVALVGGDDGDLIGEAFNAAVTQGFTVSGSQYTAAGAGASAIDAQNLLRSLSLTLATQNPPTLATVSVTVTPSSGNSGNSGAVTVEYPLNITDENELPTVTVLPPAPPVEEDSGQVAVNIAIVDPVEPGQTIADDIIVFASTITVNSGGTGIGDLLQENIANLFSVVRDGSGPATVTFTGTPATNAHGTAEFALQATDSAGGLSPVFLFTLTVNSVNDAPVVNVTEEMLNLTGGGRSATDTVSVTLTDVDVSAVAGNEDRFAQADDTLVMSVSTDVVTLTLDTASGATIAGSGTSEIRLTFTSGLTAARVKALVESVAVSVAPDVGSGVSTLTVTLTTGLNEDTGNVRTNPLPGSDTVQVNVSEAGAPLNFVGGVSAALTEGQTGNAVTLSFSRRLEENESVTVTYTFTAELGDITDPNNGEVTLAQGQNVVSIQLEANTDINVEGEETFAVQYTATFTNNEGTGTDIASRTINVAINDATPPLQVSFSETGYTFAENAGADVMLNVVSGGTNATLDSPVQVSVEARDGTAMSANPFNDYTQLTALVDIPAGPYTADTVVPITVVALSITADSDVEPDEMFTLTLSSNDARAVAVGSTEVAVTIENDDVRNETVTFDPQPVVVERGGDSVDVDVSLLPLLIPGQAATLRLESAVSGLTVDGLAALNVALNDERTSQVVTIAAASNVTLGDHDVMVMVLGTPVGALVATVPLMVTVQPGSIAITQSPDTITIGEVALQAGTTIDETITVTSVERFTSVRVTLTGDANGDLVGAMINETAETDSTFDINDDAAALQTFLSRLTVALGTQDPPEVATVTVTVRPEAYPVAEEVVLTYRLEITDANEAPGLDESVTSADLDEGNAAVGGVTLALDRALEAGETVVVSYTLDFSANSASSGDVTDSNSNPGSVTISTGNTISIRLTAFDDDTPETDETFNVVFTSIEFRTAEETITIDASGISPQTLTIPANDYPNLVSSVTRVGPEEVSEGESLMFRVELNAAVPANETATVMYAVGGDIAITDGEATIAAEQTSVTVTVAVADDTVVEDDEDVTVSISRVNFVATASAGFNLIPAQTIDFTLVDATQMMVNLAVASTSVAEGFDAVGFRNSIEVTASVVAGVTLDRDVDVRLVFDGTARSGDYAQPQVGNPLVLTFVAAPAPLQVSTNIAVTPDTIQEAEGETVTIAVGTDLDDDPAVAAGRPADVVTIVDNNLQVSVTGAGPVDEGGNAVFTVTLSGNTDANLRPDLAIPYAVTGILPADVASGDLQGSVTILASETTTTLTYPIQTDDLVEGDETAQIAVNRMDVNFPAGLLLGAGAVGDAVTADITIGDATPALQVSFSQADYRVVENDGSTTAVLNVLSGADGNVTLVSNVTIFVDTADDTAVAPGDYTAREGVDAQIVIFAGVYSTIGDTIQIPLTIMPDDTVERDEIFTLNLDASDSRAQAVGPLSVPVTIENDDATSAAVTFTPAAVTVASGSTVGVTVGTTPSLTEGQSVALELETRQGLTVDNETTLIVDLDDETTTQAVTVAASEPGDYQVTVTVSNSAGLIVTTTPPLLVTVPGIVITQTNPGELRGFTESALQAGIDIDTAIGVALFGGETISTINVTIEGTDDGDLMGAVFEATTTQGFTVVSGSEYTSATGATAMEAQDLLQSLRLTLATQTPPTRSTVTVTVTPLGDSGAVTVVYPLNIIDENEQPTVSELTQASTVEEDSGELAVNIAVVDPVEPGQTISANITMVASTITVNSGDGDLLQESIASLFSVVGDGSGTATVTFTGTPVANAHGTAEFMLQVQDSGDGNNLSPEFSFMLTVNSVNDAPVVTVTDDLRLVGGSALAVTVDVTSLSDVDVSVVAGNVDRFAQADDTLVMRVSTDVVTLTLDTAADADIEGSGTSEIQLTFTSGLTAAQVEELIESVEVRADLDAVDGDHVLTIELETGANEAGERSGELTGIVTVDVRVFEEGVPPTLESVEAVVLNEGNTAADAVRLVLSRGPQNSSEIVTVTYTLDFSGASATPTDVTDPNSGRITLETLGERTISIQLQAHADDLVEGEETFVVRYTVAFTGDGTVGTEIATDETITVAISDATPPLQVSFSEEDYTVVENAGPAVAVLNVRSDGGTVMLVSDVSVSVATADGTAVAPGDYTALAGDDAQIVISAGEYSTAGSTIDIEIPIVNDDGVEPVETFALNLDAPDPRAATVEPAEATVTIENDDVTTARVVFTPRSPVEVARGGSVDVTVSLEPPLVPGQEATLRLMTPIEGLTVSGSTTLDVVLNDPALSPVVAVAVVSDAVLATHEVMVEVLDGSVGVTVTPVRLDVTVIPAQVEITPNRTLAESEPTESRLRAGILIDAGIEVGFVSGSESISTIQVTIEGSGGGDLAGVQFSADVTEGFTVGDNEYTSATGATASQAQALLRSLLLTLATQDPPDRATVTVTVQSLGGFSEATVEYLLDIEDENAPPRVTEVLAEQPIVVAEDSEQVVVGLVIVDPVEADQTISDEVTVAASTITASNGGTAVSDLLLLQESIADLLFNADNDEPGPATVTFTGTPQPDTHGTAEFVLQVKDSGGDDLSSEFRFTLTVTPVNDAPVVTVDPAELTLSGDGLEATVDVSLSDVDVSAAAANEDRFVQADNTLMMSVSTDVVTLTLRGLTEPTGDVMLNSTTVATVAGNASSQIALTFTRGLSATQVETLVEMVEMRAVADAVTAEHVLTIALTTGVNEEGEGNDEPLTGSATVDVQVFRAGEPPTFEASAVVLDENDTVADAVTLELSRRLESTESVTVTYELDFSGASATPTDVTDPSTGRVTLDTLGGTTISIQLQANADDLVEGEETFVVRYTAAFTAADSVRTDIANEATRTVTISDATPPLQVSFSQENYPIAEDAGPAVAMLNVRSDGGTVRLVSDVSVSVATADGTAEAGTDEAPGDYTAPDDAEVVISAGVYSTAGRTINIEIPIIDDDGVEPVETFALNLDAPDPRAVAVEPDEATVMIENDDETTAIVVFTPQAVTALRRGSRMDVAVSTTPTLILGQEATLRLMTPIEGLTVSGSTTVEVMLDDQTGSQAVTIAAARDASLGTHEVTVAVLDPVAVVITTATLTVEVIEAEVLTLSIETEDLDEASTTVGGVTLTLSRGLAEGESVTVDYTLNFSGSATATDVVGASVATTGTVTLTGEGQAVISISLRAVDDDFDEGPETFEVELTAEFTAIDGTTLDVSNLSAPVELTITDNDRTAIRLRLRVFLEGALQ